MKVFEYSDYICKLGENKYENWDLLENSKINDYFFHLESFSSGYVILISKNNLNEFIPTTEMIFNSSLICKNGTKYKNYTNLKINYCKCYNVIKGNNVGEAIFKSNRKVKNIKI